MRYAGRISFEFSVVSGGEGARGAPFLVVRVGGAKDRRGRLSHNDSWADPRAGQPGAAVLHLRLRVQDRVGGSAEAAQLHLLVRDRQPVFCVAAFGECGALVMLFTGGLC
jgi:hypothetical protein